MTEYQKRIRSEAYKRNRKRTIKHVSDNTLQMCDDGTMRLRKDIRMKKKREAFNKKRNIMHSTNPWQFSDNRKPATLCGKMFSDTLNRTMFNDNVTCAMCKKKIEDAWKG